MRVVLDTSVLVAAIRSRFGASRLVLEAGLASRVRLLISTPLVLEYEAVLVRPEQLEYSGLNPADVDQLIYLICAAGVEVHRGRRLRPRLADPDDEMVLETAVNGRADAIVTFNRVDFRGVAEEFAIEILTPGELLERIGLR